MAIRTLTLTMIDPPIPDQDAVWGQAAAIDLRTPFRDTTTAYTYTVTGSLPLGLSASGHQIVGTVLEEKARAEITVEAFDGAVSQGTATFNLGATCKAGLPAPAFTNTLTDIDAAVAAFGYTTDVAVSTNMADLETAIETAFQDGGTATTPKIHRVRWTGGDLTTGEVQADFFTPAAHAWVVFDGGGSKLRSVAVDAAETNTRFFCTNVTLVGDGSNSPVKSTSTLIQYQGCKIGYLFGSDPNSVPLSPASNADFGNISFVGCHIAGGSNGLPFRNHRLTIIDCLMTHIQADHLTHFATSPTVRVEQRLIGNVMALSRQTNPATHPDNLQMRLAPSVILQYYQNIMIGDCATYGHTSMRIQKEGEPNSSGFNLDFRDNIFAPSGFEWLNIEAGQTGTASFLNTIVVPTPGFSSQAHNFGVSSLTTTIENLIVGDDTSAFPVPIDGVEVNYSLNSTASVQGAFPNIGGSLVAFTEHGTQGATTRHVPPVVQATYHPQSWRGWFSTHYEPAAGWGTFLDPVSYGGVYDWGATPTFTAPTLTSGSVTGDQLTITASEAGGVLWAFVSLNSSPPNFTLLRHGVEPDGTHDTSPNTDVKLFRIPSTSAETYTLSKNATGLHVHICMEATDGSFSTVTTITP